MQTYAAPSMSAELRRRIALWVFGAVLIAFPIGIGVGGALSYCAVTVPALPATAAELTRQVSDHQLATREALWLALAMEDQLRAMGQEGRERAAKVRAEVGRRFAKLYGSEDR